MIGHTYIDGAIIASLLGALPGVVFAGAILISVAAIAGLVVFLLKYSCSR